MTRVGIRNEYSDVCIFAVFQSYSKEYTTSLVSIFRALKYINDY